MILLEVSILIPNVPFTDSPYNDSYILDFSKFNWNTSHTRNLWALQALILVWLTLNALLVRLWIYDAIDACMNVAEQSLSATNKPILGFGRKIGSAKSFRPASGVWYPHPGWIDVSLPQWLGVTQDGKIRSNVTLDFFEVLLYSFSINCCVKRLSF